jgi:ABC-type amino acid transport substrate-binding protein
MRLKLPNLLLAATLYVAAQPAAAMWPPLKICLDGDDAPFSSVETPSAGVHVELAQALAERLQRLPALVWVQVPNRGGLGRALRQTLVAGTCDVYLGIPQGPDMARELAERRLIVSQPYLGLGYVFAAASGRSVPDAAALRAARRIGVVTATPADLHLHRLKLPRVPYASSAALIAALRAGEMDLALLWSSALAGEGGRGLVRAPAPPDDPELRTGLTMALRAADSALAAEVSSALDALRADGRIDAITARHGLPRIAPP